jgi:Tfp pilus assembly protein PilF
MIRRSAAQPAFLLACALVLGGAAPPAGTPAPRNDYAKPSFAAPLADGLRHFYARDFKTAESDFNRALLVVPDNTLAISFLNAAAAQQAGELDVVTNVEEDAVSGAPKNYVDHVRLAFSYMFQSASGRDRTQDARDELNLAVNSDPDGQAAHVGLGILRFNDRSANRAKTELLAALRTDPSNVLAREYLGQLYQTDLRDPQRGLEYVIDVPNLVPQYADIEFHIGSLMSDLGQPEAAITYLKKGIALDEDHVGEAGQHGYTLIARIYIGEHKLKEATAVLNTAVDADVDTIYAKTLLAKIKAGDYDEAGAPSPVRSGT